jgi:hypothetical protein
MVTNWSSLSNWYKLEVVYGTFFDEPFCIDPRCSAISYSMEVEQLSDASHNTRQQEYYATVQREDFHNSYYLFLMSIV